MPSTPTRARGIDCPRIDPRRPDHARLHRRQCLSGIEGGTDLRVVDTGGGDLDGGAQRPARLHHSGEQHRADRGIGGGDAVVDHLRAAGAGDRRLVDGLSVLDIVPDLPVGRDAGRAVHDSAAPRPRHPFGPALPRRRRGGGSAQGRRRPARRRDAGRSGGSARRPDRGRLRRRCLARHGGDHRDAARGGGDPALFPGRQGGELLRHVVLAGADGRGASGGTVGRPGRIARHRDRLGRRGADRDGADARSGGGARRPCHRHLEASGALHRRRRHRGGGDLDADQAGAARGRRADEHHRLGPRPRARRRRQRPRSLGRLDPGPDRAVLRRHSPG